MSFLLLAPAGLLALAAWLVPLVLHLHRRRPRQTLSFAALRWMPTGRARRRQWRVQQILLLLLRLLLLALAALVLAQPVWQRVPDAAGVYVAVMPGADPDAARAMVRDPSARWNWLAPGFPVLSMPSGESGSSASLLRELDAQLPPATKLIVVAPAVVAGLDGARPQLQREVDWHVTPGRAPTPRAAAARPLRLAGLAAGSDAIAQRLIPALVQSWHHAGHPAHGEVVHSVASLGTHDAWLVTTAPVMPAVQAWLDGGGRALVFGDDTETGLAVWHDTQGRVLARHAQSGAGQVLRITALPEIQQFPELLEADFPQRLRTLMQGAPAAPGMASAEMLAPTRGPAVAPLPLGRVPLTPWLILALALCWFAERLVAARGTAH